MNIGDTGLAKFIARNQHMDGADEDRFSETSSRVQLPSSMILSECLRKNASHLSNIPLAPLNCTFGVVLEKEPIPFRRALKKEAGMKKADISLVFVVRRPGCAACREHGQQLTELAKEDPSVAYWAIVKETGVEEEGILTFFDKFFHFPMYKDDKWLTYKAMGERKLTPFKLVTTFLATKGRWARKNIPNRLKGGDVWVQGGILLFKQGRLRFAYEEEYGKELVIADIRSAIKFLQQEEDDDMTQTCTEASDHSFMFHSTRIAI